jgi:hypothetical protein
MENHTLAQSAHACDMSDIWTRLPANDNAPGRGGPKGDRWRWLIERLKAIDMGLAMFAAKERLRGVTCEAFCVLFLQGAKLAGWECLEDWEG